MKIIANILVKGNNNIIKAFGPEEKQMKRSNYNIKKTKNGINFSINAEDAIAFRATISAITQLLATNEKMVNIDAS